MSSPSFFVISSISAFELLQHVAPVPAAARPLNSREGDAYLAEIRWPSVWASLSGSIGSKPGQ